MLRRHNRSRSGFTLIEVLVAMAIISIALLAALRAAAMATSSVGDLRGRLLAGWVAENLLEEHRAKGDWPALGIQSGKTRQGGFDFNWREEIVSTPNAAFRRVNVLVTQAPQQPEVHALARLSGFVVNPP